MGGDFSNPVDGGAGVFDFSDAENFDSMTGYPAAETAKIDSAASLMHGMNANTFTGAAVHVKPDTDMETIAKAIENNLQERQWMCGIPDKVFVAFVEDYIVFAFGHQEMTDAFKTHLEEAYPDAETFCYVPMRTPMFTLD